MCVVLDHLGLHTQLRVVAQPGRGAGYLPACLGDRLTLLEGDQLAERVGLGQQRLGRRVEHEPALVLVPLPRPERSLRRAHRPVQLFRRALGHAGERLAGGWVHDIKGRARRDALAVDHHPVHHALFHELP